VYQYGEVATTKILISAQRSITKTTSYISRAKTRLQVSAWAHRNARVLYCAAEFHREELRTSELFCIVSRNSDKAIVDTVS
jgi:hypothetical protein